jgi:hypothetical protein
MEGKTIKRALTPAEIEEFWKLCDWTHEVWMTHRSLFDDNLDSDLLLKSKFEPILSTLNVITQEYAILQVAKLHDPSGKGGNSNIGLEFMRNRSGRNAETEQKLEELHIQLNGLFEQIKSARNKIVAHNDRRAILGKTALGGFPKDADLNYFKQLQEFVALVQNGPFQFSDYSKTDAEILLRTLVSECREKARRFPHTRSASCPTAPVSLSDGAREIWNEHAPRLFADGLLTDLDHRAFTMLCESCADYASTCRAVENQSDAQMQMRLRQIKLEQKRLVRCFAKDFFQENEFEHFLAQQDSRLSNTADTSTP